jgi:hypothetical protein
MYVQSSRRETIEEPTLARKKRSEMIAIHWNLSKNPGQQVNSSDETKPEFEARINLNEMPENRKLIHE